MKSHGLPWVWALALSGLLGSTGCLGRSRASELYPSVAEHQNKEIKEIRFAGAEPFSSDTLFTLIDSEASHCNLLGLPICIPLVHIGRHTHRLNVEIVRRDVARLAAFYRRAGYFGTRVVPRAEPVSGSQDQVQLTYLVRRGDPIILDSLAIEGVDHILSVDSLTRSLPLKRGEVFDVGEFEASADQVQRALQSRGYAYAEILRNYSVDTLADRAVASIVSVPGVQARVDSIIVIGADHLGRREAVRQLTIRKGDLLRLNSLVRSQSNLYNLEIVQLASVTIAPDSLQKTKSDSSTVTVLVSIVEAPVNQAEGAVGFGTVECFKTEGSWTNRSLAGAGRRIYVTGSLSKIGLGGFTNAGLGRNLCRAFVTDTFEHRLDYRAAVEFAQPYFFSPRNQLTMNVHAERVSEPNVYQRQSFGGGASVNHRLARRSFLAGSVDLERVTTLASPVLFCTAFQVCAPDDLEHINEPRYRNALGVSFVRDRTNNPLDATRGYITRSGFTWATPWLSSTVTFSRWTGEAAWYRTISPGVVFASSLRLGTFFGSATLNPATIADDFLPPEERFYAGGATTVRGYGRNELGPGVYVTGVDEDTGQPSGDPTFVPLGGTNLGVVNAEIRFPSPILKRQVRLAAFIDGGIITNDVEGSGWRFTPGAGVRIATPVGPARVDVGYNPYNPVSGILFVVSGDSITAVSSDFRPDTPGFFGRMRLHVAIGQAF